MSSSFLFLYFFFFKQKSAYDMRISDWSSDVCSSDLRIRLPDGGIIRIGYDSQNGRDYPGIGKLMRDRGLLESGQTSMQVIMDYLNSHPEEGKAIMNENNSSIYFREITGATPIGAMVLTVTGA